MSTLPDDIDEQTIRKAPPEQINRWVSEVREMANQRLEQYEESE